MIRSAPGMKRCHLDKGKAARMPRNGDRKPLTPSARGTSGKRALRGQALVAGIGWIKHFIFVKHLKRNGFLQQRQLRTMTRSFLDYTRDCIIVGPVWV